MIILTSTTDKIQVKLAGAITTTQLKCFASYRDTTSSTIEPKRNIISTNNTTAVDLVDSPASSTQRVVDYISIFNTDSTTATVTINFSDNGTLYSLFVASLAANEKIEYQEGYGFKVINNAGAIKTILNQGTNTTSSTLSTVVLGSDVTNSNASANTIADITSLSFGVNAGNTYYFRFVIPYTSALTTTGSRWSINGPGVTSLSFRSMYSLTATTQTLNPALDTYDTPAAANATTASTTGNIAIIEGFITPSSNGTVIGRFASEVSSSAITAKAGAILQYQQII